MAETFNKKEKQKRKQQKKKEKEQRKADRQSQVKSGSLEDMLAYVDENGNLSATPPDPTRKTVIDETNIVIGSRNIGGVQTDLTRKGRVTKFDLSKGYGFIRDSQTHESIFVHANSLLTPIKENDMVSFQTERTVKGLAATGVKKIA
ncbi:MAG TPA: cold shock domain-containing protein [Chryseosolibacter sp.]